MILKKPYAFLIKYFRLIHLALALLLGAGASKLYNVLKFFNTYVDNNYTTTVVTNLHKIYTPSSLFWVIIVILVLLFAITTLLIHKKKPVKLYTMMILYYIIILIGLFYISSVLRGFEFELLSSTVSRSLRDILVIVYLPQFVFIGFVLLRTIGFNVKKFEFGDERKELSKSSLDDEEFEVNLNFEGYRLRQTINRVTREMGYYIKENRFVVICILIVSVVVGWYYIHNNATPNFDSNYRMGTTFVYNKVNVTVEDAMLTNLDYNGNIISDDYYLALKVKVNNTSGDVVAIDYNNFILVNNTTLVKPEIRLSSSFIDLASSAPSGSVKHNSEKKFVLVYKISENGLNNDFSLQIYKGSVYRKGDYYTRNINVNLKVRTVEEVNVEGNFYANDLIEFKETLLGNTTLKVKEYLLTKNYYYKYKTCFSDETCKDYLDGVTVSTKNQRYNNKLLVLPVEYVLDLETDNSDSFSSLQNFAENYVDIQYKIDGETYSDLSINVTPQNASDFFAFEVPKEIENANIIQVLITIRNKRYIINLKS